MDQEVIDIIKELSVSALRGSQININMEDFSGLDSNPFPVFLKRTTSTVSLLFIPFDGLSLILYFRLMALLSQQWEVPRRKELLECILLSAKRLNVFFMFVLLRQSICRLMLKSILMWSLS